MLAQPLDTGNPKNLPFFCSIGYICTKAVQTIFLGFSITLVGLVNNMYLRMYSVKDGTQFHQLPATYPSCINVESVCHVGPAG